MSGFDPDRARRTPGVNHAAVDALLGASQPPKQTGWTIQWPQILGTLLMTAGMGLTWGAWAAVAGIGLGICIGVRDG